MFVNGTEIYKFKAKDSGIVASPLSLGNNSKDWSTDNMKRTRFNGYVYGFSVDYDATDVGDIINGYVYDFSVDYDATDVDDIKDVHKCLMKKMT